MRREASCRLPRVASLVLRVTVGVICGAFVALPMSQGQHVYFGQLGDSITPPSSELEDRVLELGQAAAAAGLPVSVTTGSSGEVFLNGMLVWELGLFTYGSDYDAIASQTLPAHVAINLGSIQSVEKLGELEIADVVKLYMIAVHERAHGDFAVTFFGACSSDPDLWLDVLDCHGENTGRHVCNEAYAYSKAIREMCAELDDVEGAKLRAAIEEEIAEQMNWCAKFEARCEKNNEACSPCEHPPPCPGDMPMPRDHQPCGGCEACSECPKEG